MNQKKLRRLYREEGLQVRKRGGRKRALGTCQGNVTFAQLPFSCRDFSMYENDFANAPPGSARV
jgi:hypothetical protein